MRKYICGLFLATFLFVFLPQRAFAQGAGEMLLDNRGTVTLISPYGAEEGISSLQFSLAVDVKDGAEVKFEFAESSAKIKEYRYSQDGKTLNIYIAGTKALFTDNSDTLTIGKVVVLNEKGENAAATVSVKPEGVRYVYGTEMKSMEGLTLPAPVEITAGLDGLVYVNGKYYFYENGVMATSKEAVVNGTWRWFDADGTMAVDKDVYLGGSDGKWVRYNENGEMIKGEDFRYGGWYYFEPVTGTMMKGPVTLEDGRRVYYDTVNGQMLKGVWEINGQPYHFDEVDGHLISGGQQTCFWVHSDGKDFWYEDWRCQGWNPADSSYRGKEIYDPATDAWYWLDAVQRGARTVSKDVYMESYSAYPDREDGTGKWVRYDAKGRMVKGWNTTGAGTYYFEEITGAMAKGRVVIDGVEYYFDEETGIRRN